MKYSTGDIWELAAQPQHGWVIVPTNTDVKQNGNAVMGKGLAKQAADQLDYLPRLLGQHIKTWGEEIFAYEAEQKWSRGTFGILQKPMRVVCLPTKTTWRQGSDLELIERGCKALKLLAYQLNNSPDVHEFFVPRLGAGLGGLDWEREVRPVVDSSLDSDHFIGVNPA